jgi:hypothetical protein
MEKLYKLQNSTASDDINKEIQSAIALIFWPTDFIKRTDSQERALINSRKS